MQLPERINMGAIQLILLLTCMVLSPSSTLSVEPAAKTEAESEAEAEATCMAEVQRTLSSLQLALSDAREPLARRLEAARDALAPVLAALEAHAATLVLHSRHRFESLQPALQEKLEAARALLARTQQDLMANVTEGGAAALSEVTAAVSRAREQLASLWLPEVQAPSSGAPDQTGVPSNQTGTTPDQTGTPPGKH